MAQQGRYKRGQQRGWCQKGWEGGGTYCNLYDIHNDILRTNERRDAEGGRKGSKVEGIYKEWPGQDRAGWMKEEPSPAQGKAEDDGRDSESDSQAKPWPSRSHGRSHGRMAHGELLAAVSNSRWLAI